MAHHEWSGEMLDRPEMVSAFAGQLRRTISEYAEFVARIRRDAEAMWQANPPEGYGSFEAWWRQRWVSHPMRAIQKHLEAAAKETFALEARYRRGRHEIPERRAQQRASRPAIERAPAPRQVRPGRGEAPPLPRSKPRGEVSFLDLVQGEGQGQGRRKGRSA